MAEKNAPAADEAAPPKKGLPLVPIIVVAAVMIVEAAIIGAVFMLAGGPSEVRADTAAADQEAELLQPVELLIVADKFQNTKTGQRFLYDTEVYAVVAAKDRARVEQLATEMRASIQSDVNIIFRRAEPSHLHEAELSTLTRQIKAAMLERFGHDPDGKPYLQDVIIGKCTEFAADF